MTCPAPPGCTHNYGHVSYQDPTNQAPLSLNSENAALRNHTGTKTNHPLH